jgi:hypothetical protein
MHSIPVGILLDNLKMEFRSFRGTLLPEKMAAQVALFVGAAFGLVLPGTPVTQRSARTSPRMSIAVFGATGGVGGEVAFQALGRGESVRCLVRDKARLKVPLGSGGASAGMPLVNDAMAVFEGTVTSASDVAKVFESGDVTGVHAA